MATMATMASTFFSSKIRIMKIIQLKYGQCNWTADEMMTLRTNLILSKGRVEAAKAE